MKKFIRDAWLAALRSGDYAQTSGALQCEEAYCCLGVLCMVAADLGYYEPTYEPHVKRSELAGGLLRDQLAIRELMRRQDTLLGRDGGDEPWIEVKLAEMNDAGFTFTRIAEYIEETIPEENNDEAQVVEGAAGEVLGHDEGAGAPQEASLQQEGAAGVSGSESTEPA